MLMRQCIFNCNIMVIKHSKFVLVLYHKTSELLPSTDCETSIHPQHSVIYFFLKNNKKKTGLNFVIYQT